MNTVNFRLDEKGKGAFYIMDGDKQIGEMEISISENKLTAYHTKVQPEYEGKGFAKELLKSMVTYARENGLKIIPLCPYVHAQFKRHPDDYKDIWLKGK